MAANIYFQEYVVFSTRKLDFDQVPGRCVVCEVSQSLFEYQKQVDFHPVRKESGYCCTACALNMLLELANKEARSLAALTKAST